MSSEDLRKIMLHKHVPVLGGIEFQTWMEQKIYLAMDEYFQTRSMELLDYMSKNEIECMPVHGDGRDFFYKGEWITKEALFQNFL